MADGTSTHHRLPPRQRGILFGILLLGLWCGVGTFGFSWIEGWSLADGLYMTLITISTVGYGEVHPLSTGGRLFASLLIVGGLGTALYTFSRLGQVLIEGEISSALGRRKMKSEMGRLEHHFIICGFGRIGEPVAEGLRQDQEPFCILDQDPELVPQLQEKGYLYLIGDANDESLLEAAGIRRARALLALLPADPDNLMLTLTARELNPSITVIARASDEKAEPRLKRGGADRVISPYRIASARVLQAAVKPAVLDFMELVSEREHLALSLEELTLCEGSRLTGQTIAGSHIRARHGVVIVAVKRPDGRMLFNPDPGVKMAAGDVLVVLGRAADLARLAPECGGTPR